MTTPDLAKDNLDVERVSTVEDLKEESQQQPVLFDAVAEKKLLRKCDLYVLPPVSFIFFLAFLDRTNIGNARIQGLTEDLQLSGHDYNVALFIFFIPYILFEVPSNIIIKKLAPSTWLSLVMVLWGIATVGQGLIRNIEGLIALRFLLGLFEAGVFPGCAYLISMYYKRFELQWRMSLFFCAAIIAGAISGLLAYGIAHLGGVGGYGAWRWIFILEGLFTIVVGVISKWWIADWPETAKFLTDEERSLLIARLAQDTGEAKMDELTPKARKRILSDWKVYVGTLAYLGIVNTGYSGSFFIPTILNEMGYKAAEAQVRTIPIYVVSTVICLVVAYATDRLKHRYTFVMGGLAVAAVGYGLLLGQEGLSVGVKYFALFLIVGGGYAVQPIVIAWLANNVSGHYKRSVSSALQIGFGNVGGIVASNIFLQSEAPRYTTGYGVSLSFLGLCALACTVLFFGIKRENKKRDRGERDYRLEKDDAHNLGDDHPSWRFTS
ncbi:major facilitator superfamily domain-containing protein [Xylaria bambusicola]|uniref:major facilitator superfamily domain-containing protein n=1 Tax=Xylaria bambusicola TaxID=326684 RepID=UPI002008BADA|nr:major facilitator superfamily domain-containing protein [Xylaria bambusicola]KAI0515168.1 major facilitator superfamily domain-containing protein [Xylaria bambusicola]